MSHIDDMDYVLATLNTVVNMTRENRQSDIMGGGHLHSQKENRIKTQSQKKRVRGAVAPGGAGDRAGSAGLHVYLHDG